MYKSLCLSAYYENKQSALLLCLHLAKSNVAFSIAL